MREHERDCEIDPEWLRWREGLQSDVPTESLSAMRSAIRDFHDSNRVPASMAERNGLSRTSSQGMTIDPSLTIIEKVPRWLGYAGAAIAVMAACVVTILFSRNADQQPLGVIRLSRDSMLSVSPRPHSLAPRSIAFPSTMVSLTGPENTIPSFARIRNPSFESIDQRSDQPAVQPIPGWTFPSRCRDAGYRIELDANERFDGRRSAMIECVVEQPSLFGNLMQTLDATNFRNKTIRVSASMRADVPNDGSQVLLWLRIDREDFSIDFIDTTHDRPVRTQEWQYSEIEAHISNDAHYLNLGAFLMGNGTAWIDAFRLELID